MSLNSKQKPLRQPATHRTLTPRRQRKG